MQYNVALVIILIIFLMFSVGCGRSLGSLYCAKTHRDAQDAQMALLFNMLFAAMFGWWAYYEYKRSRQCISMIYIQAHAMYPDPDPNYMSALKKREEYQRSRDIDPVESAATLAPVMAGPEMAEGQFPTTDFGTELRRPLNVEERMAATDQTTETMNNPGALRSRFS